VVACELGLRSLIDFWIIVAPRDRDKKWVPRQRGGNRIISRMYSVSPSDPEKFHLRLLLLHMPGARSYTDLLTVDRVICWPNSQKEKDCCACVCVPHWEPVSAYACPWGEGWMSKLCRNMKFVVQIPEGFLESENSGVTICARNLEL
jgi:hypothetical protein